MSHISYNKPTFLCFIVGLRFEETADAEVWHSDVHLYSVFDLSSSELLGYFYLDLYSRFYFVCGIVNFRPSLYWCITHAS